MTFNLENEPYKPDIISRFLIDCAAPSWEALEQCSDKEHKQMLTLGTIILFVGIFAAIAGGYAIYTLTHNLAISIILGFIWGGFIFSLDRFIVTSLSKSAPFLKQLGQFFIRLAIAIVISIVIATPLELLLFEQEINQFLLEKKQEKLKELDSKQAKAIEEKRTSLVFNPGAVVTENKATEIEKVNNNIASLRDEIKEAEKTYLEMEEKAFYEKLTGKESGRPGEGPIYKELKEKAAELEKRYQEIKARNEPTINTLLKQIEALGDASKKVELAKADIEKMKVDNEKIIADEITKVIKEYNQKKEDLDIEFSESLMARLTALGELGEKNSHVKGASLFITLLFIVIEISAILVKILTPRNSYDDFLETLDQKRQQEAQIKLELHKDVLIKQKQQKLLDEEDKKEQLEQERERKQLERKQKIEQIEIKQDIIFSHLEDYKKALSNTVKKGIEAAQTKNGSIPKNAIKIVKFINNKIDTIIEETTSSGKKETPTKKAHRKENKTFAAINLVNQGLFFIISLIAVSIFIKNNMFEPQFKNIFLLSLIAMFIFFHLINYLFHNTYNKAN